MMDADIDWGLNVKPPSVEGNIKSSSVSTPRFQTDPTFTHPTTIISSSSGLNHDPSRSKDIMKFLSFSRAVVLLSLFAAVQSVAVPRNCKLRSYAIACIVDAYDLPSRIVARDKHLIPKSEWDIASGLEGSL